MKKIMTLLCAAVLSVAAVHAQDSTSMKKHHHENFDRHHKGDRLKDLNLTQDQKDQLQKMKEETKAQKEKIQNDATLSQEQKMEKMKELRKQNKEKFAGILTPDQKSKLKEEKSKRKENYEKRKQGPTSAKK